MDTALAFACIALGCFLLGSVPWGLVISRLFYKKDLREVGSGNIGTTNAIRAMGKVGGYAVFVLDFGKGLLSGFIGLWVAQAANLDATLTGVALALAFFACTYGHIFTPWLKFKGGKGIAVAVGCLFVTFGPIGALIELAVFAVWCLPPSMCLSVPWLRRWHVRSWRCTSIGETGWRLRFAQ